MPPVRGRLFACLSTLSLLLFAVAASCAAGETDPGETRDNCRLRDCGAAVGGRESSPDEEDEGVPIEDTGTVLPDSAPADTKPDTACSVTSGAACALYPQCGCTGAMNCDVPPANFGDGKAACVAAGMKTTHQKCTTTGECAKGLTCYYDVCMPFCAVTGDCTGARCNPVLYVDGTVVKSVPDMRVCMAECDPLNPSKACGASTTCLFPTATATTCAAAGLSTTATSCASNPFACAPGYVCVGSGDCKRWCRIGLAGDCPGGKACNKISTAPTIGTIEYGVCAY
jgi:hypothetical protein